MDDFDIFGEPSSLSAAEPDAAAAGEAIGRTAIALFNVAVSTATPLPAAPPWVACVGALLRRAEIAVHSAWQRTAVSDARDSSSSSTLSSGFTAANNNDTLSSWRIPTEPPASGTPELCSTRRVPTRRDADLPCAAFFTEYLSRGKPVLITGHLVSEAWGALDYFADLRALHEQCGERLVPVNIGSPLVGYAGMQHWPLGRLIEERLLPSNASHNVPPPDGAALDEERHCHVAYMSQHHLLHQQRHLQSLLAVPQYTLGRELSPTNVWIGTRGTVTSLHSDPADNLLCQVAGFKYFRLYGLEQTPKLFATTLRSKNTNSFGTSPVRVEAPLPPEHAAFAEAEYVEGILAPGDMLFIPKSVWHYVRSLTTSVSVNFWFDS